MVIDAQDVNPNQSRDVAGVTGLQDSNETQNYESLMIYSEAVPARISTKHKSTIIGSCLKITNFIAETRCALLNNLQSHCVLVVCQSDNDTTCEYQVRKPCHNHYNLGPVCYNSECKTKNDP